MSHDIKIQKIPDLKKTILFSLLAIREAKKKGIDVNIELNLTNAYTFDGPKEYRITAEEKLLTELKKQLPK